MADLIFEPGFYNKIRIDDRGNIVGVGDLEPGDLPNHKHSVEDIKEGLTNTVLEVISELFANSEATAVKFTYDKNTKKVFADVNIDGSTIDKNEYGELVSISGGSGSSGISDSDLSEIETKIGKVEDDIRAEVEKALAQLFMNTADSPIRFKYDKKLKTYTAEVAIDGLTVVQNEYGELSAVGGGDGSISTDCGNHKHTSDQITDFEKAVVNIFNNFSKTLNFDISKYIDGSTIKINEAGQLVAVRTALEVHTHTLKEIVDYVPPEPAAVQPMSDLGEEVNYNLGVIDFSKLNIGFSILALSEYIKNNVNKKLTELSNRIDEINFNNDNSGVCLLYPDPMSVSNILFDKTTKFYREVYKGKTLDLIFDFVPVLTGSITLMLDGKDVSTASLDNLLLSMEDGIFKVDRVYKKKTFNAKVLKIDVSGLVEKEGLYTFQLRFDSSNQQDFSNQVKVYATPNEEMEYEWGDLTPTHKIGEKKFYNDDFRIYKISIKDFDNYRFVNNSGLFVNGEFVDSDIQNTTIKLNNLFSESEIELEFPYKKESSSSELYKCLIFQNDHIIDDVLYPVGDTDYAFEIPNTQEYNSLKISGVDLDLCYIQRGSDRAYGNVVAALPATYGRIPLDTDNYGIISLLNCYNNGRDNLIFHLKGNQVIDLKEIKVTGVEI